MKPVKVTTIEQARALPELKNYVDRILEEDDPDYGPAGTKVRERLVPDFHPRPTDDGQILFFLDTDGRCMHVVYTKDGPTKAPFPTI